MAAERGAVVVLGQVTGSYGVRGWLKVRAHTAAADTLLQYPTWWLKSEREEAWREFERVDGRLHSGALIVELRGIDTREAALALKGWEIGVPRTALPATSAGEIYWDDLTGLEVVNRAGIVLGQVCGMTEHGAHPLLRVARPAGSGGPERLIPYVSAIVYRVDMGAGRIEVDWGEDF